MVSKASSSCHAHHKAVDRIVESRIGVEWVWWVHCSVSRRATIRVSILCDVRQRV